MRKFLVGFVSFAISFFSLAIHVEAKSIEVKSQVEPLTITAATTDTAYESQWALQASKVSDVWPTTTGSGVIVAVIDSGSGPNPDLDQNLLPGRTITRGRITDNAADVDIIGHGTHVAGIIAARSNNNIGILERTLQCSGLVCAAERKIDYSSTLIRCVSNRES